MASLFDDINQFDEGFLAGRREAAAVAHKRVHDCVGSYLRLSKSTEERQARLDYVIDDIRQIVAEVAEEYSVDHDKLLDAIEENLKGEGVTDINGELSNAPSAVGEKTSAKEDDDEDDDRKPEYAEPGKDDIPEEPEGTEDEDVHTAAGHRDGCECGFCKNKGNIGKPKGVIDDEEKSDKDASEPEWSEKAKDDLKEASIRIADASRDGGGAVKRVSLPKGDGKSIGTGPSPKIDKKRWKPNALNPEGNLPAVPEGIEMNDSAHPTERQDLIDESRDYSRDFDDKIDAQLTHQDLPSGEGDSFNTDKNISQENQMGSWTEAQGDAVTPKVFASFAEAESAIARFEASNALEGDAEKE